jgi:hypothetical protein
MERASSGPFVYDRCLLLSMRCASNPSTSGNSLFKLVQLPASNRQSIQIEPPPGLGSTVSAEAATPNQSFHRSSPPHVPVPTPASTSLQLTAVAEDQVLGPHASPLTVWKLAASTLEQHQLDDDHWAFAEAMAPTRNFQPQPSPLVPALVMALTNLQHMPAEQQTLQRSPAPSSPICEFDAPASEQYQLIDDEQLVERRQPIDDGQWLQVAHRATRKDVGSRTACKKTSKLSKPKIPVSLANPLPQKGKSIVPPPRLLVAGLVVSDSQRAQVSSGTKWWNSPVERLSCSQEAERVDPDLACYLWDRTLQRPKASRRGIF